MGSVKGRVFSNTLTPLCVLKILEDHTDIEHHLTQKDIISFLQSEYQVEKIDRKSIGRALDHLKEELDIEIMSDRKGFWLDSRILEDYELQLLIDSVFTSRYISKGYSKDLIDKLVGLGNEYFKSHVKYTYSMDNLNKTDNKAVFYNMETIHRAIEKNKQIEFDFNKYGSDLKLHVTSHHKVSPFMFIVHNQRYYLMFFHEEYKQMEFFRMDHMTSVKVLEDQNRTPIRKIPGWEDGITNSKLASRPYLFSDKIERVTFLVNENAFDYIIDWLGYDIELEKVTETKSDKLRVTVKSSPKAMKYFALQFVDVVEVQTPKKLREEITASIKDAINKYAE